MIDETYWTSGRVPNGFWDTKANRHAYLRWLGNRLGYRDPRDWYRIRREDFLVNYGAGLLAGWYGDSPSAAVVELFPRRRWLPWKFSKARNGYWKSRENRTLYMNWLAGRLRITEDEGWYQVRKSDFERNDGSGLLATQFGDSVIRAVAEHCPDMRGQEWRFASCPHRFWQSKRNRRRYMDWLFEHLGLTAPEGWYQISPADVEGNYGLTLFTQFGSSLAR